MDGHSLTPFHTDGKGLPLDVRDGTVWYHGSPLELTLLAAGSSITRNEALAAASAAAAQA